MNKLKGSIAIMLAVSLLASCNVAKMVANEMMKVEDKDKDGYLSFEEFWNVRKTDAVDKKQAEDRGMSHREKAEQDFNKADINKDNRLSEKELENFVASDK